MWRSWVDKINTLNKSPAEEHKISKEELVKREEQKESIQASWQKCNDPTMSEQERSDSFLGDFLPKLIACYDLFDAEFTLNCVPDMRAFFTILSKELINGIRKVPEHKSKSKSSQALMDNLRSQNHLYNVLKAIQVIASGPVSIALVAAQQRIPSIIMKLYRLLIDLPPSYYSATVDEPIIPEEEEQQQGIKSIEDVGETLINILTQFVQKPEFLQKLLNEDAFFMVIRIITTKPADGSFDPDKEPVYAHWKRRLITILGLITYDEEVSQYLHQRRCVSLIASQWTDTISTKSKLGVADHHEILLGLQLLICLLRGSVNIHSYILIDELSQSSGYAVIRDILYKGPYHNDVLPLKVEIINALASLTYLGKLNAASLVFDGLPYQHADFKLPSVTEDTDKIVKNTEAFKCLTSILLHPSDNTKHSFKQQLPSSIIIHTFSAFKQILKAHPCNYFIVESTNALPQLIENIESFDTTVQEEIMQLLLYVMIDLNFVPLKELAVLSLHLQSNSSGKMISVICTYLVKLLKASHKYDNVVQGAGLVKIMSLLLSDTIEKLQAGTPITENIDPFLSHVTTNFDLIIDTVIMMNHTTSNRSLFRKSCRANLFDLLQYAETRRGGLKLFEHFSSTTYNEATGDDNDNVSTLTSSIFNNRAAVSALEAGNAFTKVMEAVQSIANHDLDFRLEVLNTIKRVFITHKPARDVFRKVDGYVSLVSMIVALEGAFDDPQQFFGNSDNSQEAMEESILTTLREIFSVLSESMREHDINKRFFLKDVGYSSVEDALILTGAFKRDDIPRQIFSILFAFALDDNVKSDKKTNDELENIVVDIKSSASVKLVNPEILPTILRLQKLVSTTDPQLSHDILCIVYALAQSSRGNQVKMNGCGLIMDLLKRVFPEQCPDVTPPAIASEEREILLRIIKRLIIMGLNYEELRYIFRRFNIQDNNSALEISPGLLDLVLQTASRSRWPNFLQFDKSSPSQTSIEIPQLKNFPPQSQGYTLTAWIHIERQDEYSNILLFSLWDSDDYLAFRVYIDAKTKTLKVFNPSARFESGFESFPFQTGYWYHVAIVHHKSRLSLKSSTMNLYVNGTFIEQVACPYVPQPSATTETVAFKVVIGSFDKSIQEPSQLVWNLGPIYLMQEVLEKETINLLFNLGARYNSLFQDSLHHYQTYEAATALIMNLRNMSKSRRLRKELAQSPHAFLRLLNDGHLYQQQVTENKIILAFFASNVLSEGGETGLTCTGFNLNTDNIIKDLTCKSSRILLNTAIPKVEIALRNLGSMGHLLGDVIVAHPAGLDESLWKIGGCGVVLKLVELSTTPEMLCKLTSLLFEMIRYSWRNSADMERSHGYEIYAQVLKNKRDLISIELFELLLVFVGKNSQTIENSIINNPLAYRYIVLNFNIWKKTSPVVQKAHLDQFILFFETSNTRHYNVKRLPKIHLVKKFLLALRMNVYAKELIPHVKNAFKAVLLSNWTTENIRAVATFLASTIKSNTSASTMSSLSIHEASDSTTSLSSNISFEMEENITDKGLISDAKLYGYSSKVVSTRNIIMEALQEILCDVSRDLDYIHKFCRTVTNKWPLLFLTSNSNPYTVLLAARILSRLCVTQGGAFVHKFKSISEGFSIMRYSLPNYWNLVELYEVLTLTMLNIDIARYPTGPNDFDVSAFTSYLQEGITNETVPIAEILPILLAMWDEARRFVDTSNVSLSQTPMLARLNRIRSNSVDRRPSKEKDNQAVLETAQKNVTQMFKTFVELFNDLYLNYKPFKEAYDKQEILDSTVSILFDFVCNTHQMTAEDELISKDVTVANLGLESLHSPTSPLSTANDTIGTVTDTDGFIQEDDSGPSENLAVSGSRFIKRGGTATLTTKTSPHVSKQNAGPAISLKSAIWTQANSATYNLKITENAMMEALLNFVVDICVQSIVDPASKNVDGSLLAVFSAVPPSPHEEQVLFEGFLMTHILQKLKATAQLDTHLLLDSRVLAKLAQFSQVSADAVIHGRFRERGVEQTYDLLATILEILHTENFSGYYGGNDISVKALYKSFNRMIIAKISILESGDLETEKIDDFLHYCIHHQKIILSSKNTDIEFLRSFCYHLYRYLFIADDKARDAATSFWKLFILQKPENLDNVLHIRTKGVESQDLIAGFKHMLEMDHESFHTWLDSRKVELNRVFMEHVSKAWDNTIQNEIKYSKEMFKNFITRRINKLKKIQKKESFDQSIINNYRNEAMLWSQSIYEVEMSRFTKALQDFHGHENFVQSEWSRMAADFVRERSIWGPEKDTSTKWRLDYTEGPNRMRKRLQATFNMDHLEYLPKHEAATLSTNDKQDKVMAATTIDKRDVELSEIVSETVSQENRVDEVRDDQHSVTTADDSSVSESLSKLDGEDEDGDEDISFEEDKNRKVLRLLEQGDMVLDVYNVSQIAGLDACEGLLLLCKNNIYLIDNFFQLKNGEVVEIWDVPKEERDQYLILLAQAAGVDNESDCRSSGELHTCRKWANADLRDVFKRRFLFRDVALEIFLNDGQNALITVALSERDELFSKLVNRVPVHEESESTVFGQDADQYAASGLGNSFKLSSIFGASSLSSLTQRWERREISNFQYLMYLNAIAGRSYNDLTQYPVFPWILADYYSSELDLTKTETFRDLSKPMGAQTEERRQEFSERYRQWSETDDPAPAFHYGTHYSSAMIVCSFLIRLEPFTQHYLKLQGGTFDHADRLFDSISKAWESASEKNMGDVRELIPEFFYLPEFLTNVNRFNFGVKQNTGEVIDSVILPPWAHNDPKIFIQRHREALESDYVSENLHHWIDLIFGYKQQGQEAIDNTNVFHHVSYEGAVDLDSITDMVEKTATIGIINNFGQTSRQLFKRPHPSRSPRASGHIDNQSSIESNLDNLIQSYLPVRDVKQEVASISIYKDKLGVTACQQQLIPPDGMRYIEWGFSDNSLRVYSTETGKVLKVFENMHVGFISCACFVNSQTLITGGTDNLVCIWKIKENGVKIDLLECLKGHTSAVNTVASSRSYSILVSGSNDKTAIVWDINRRQYVRSLRGHENGVSLVEINNTTGDIITCSGHTIRVWTVNGDLYLKKSACPSSESILACMFYEQKMAEWSNRELIVTGHRNGIIKFWAKQLKRKEKLEVDEWSLELLKEITHSSRVDPSFDRSDIVALYLSPSKKSLFTGNRHGLVYAFVLPETMETYHFQKDDKCKECMKCRKYFSVLERKTHCRTCGGIFCSSCMVLSPDRYSRFCESCFAHIFSRN